MNHLLRKTDIIGQADGESFDITDGIGSMAVGLAIYGHERINNILFVIYTQDMKLHYFKADETQNAPITN